MSGSEAQASVASEPPEDVRTPEGRRYVLVARLGAGSMGRVWLARDELLGREVALKEVLHDTPELEARLRAEVALTASLDHPGIVPVYDLGRLPDGRLFSVMRLVRGATLRAWLERQPSLEQRIRRVAEAAHAVGFAHRRGLAHRDLKPENLLVEDGGAAQVADWGLARRLGEPGGRAGTEGFVAPELERGGVVAATCDVYSLGCVLRGVLPQPSPPELLAVCAKATAPQPEARYADAEALAVELDAWLDGRRVEAHEYGPVELASRFVRAWRGPLVLGALGLLAAFVALTVAWRHAETQRGLALQSAQHALERERRLLEARAVAESEAGARAEAEVLAARALELGPSPAATGVLAGFALSEAPRLLELGPACQRGGVFEGGGWCRGPLDSRVWRGGEAWHVALRLRQVVADGRWLVLRDEDERLWLDEGHGPLRPLGVARRHGAFLAVSEAKRLVVSADRGRVELHDVLWWPRDTVVPCGDGPVQASWWDGAALSHLCVDGTLVRWTEGRLERAQLDFSAVEGRLGPAGQRLSPPSLVSLAVGRSGHVFLGTSSGEVWRLDGQRVEPVEDARRGAIEALSLAPGGRRLFVASLEGSPRVIEPGTGRALTLPRVDAGPAVFADDGQLVTARFARWALPAQLPLELRARDGIATLDVDAAGTRLVAAGAGGSLRRWSLRDGAVDDPPLGWVRTIKTVAWRGAEVWVGGVDDEALLELEGDTVRRHHLGVRLKHLGTAGGALWALGYDAPALWWNGAARFDGEARAWRDARQLSDGSALWLAGDGSVFEVAGPAQQRLRFVDPEASFVAGTEGLVFVATSRVLRARSANGDVVWERELQARPTALVASRRGPIVGTATGEVLFFDLEGTLHARGRRHRGVVGALAVTDDGRVFSGGWDAHVYGWRLEGLPELRSLEARWGLQASALLDAR